MRDGRFCANSQNLMKHVCIYSDGGCQGNPGPGGWAAVLRYGDKVKEISGGEPATTNNRMELKAAIEALNALREPCEVEFHTDSNYLREGISKWIGSWKARNWRTLSKEPVKNEDLWRALDAARQKHMIDWRWVKGHAGTVDNERCDVLAGEEMAKVRKQYSREQLKALLAAFKTGSKPVETQSLDLRT
jgi:ribonuclease HI